MTETRCDRCNALIPEDDAHELTLVAKPGGHVESVADDLCERCVKALRDFCRPLPTPTPEPR